jgi:cAMP-dependent protein kinase regulator
MLTLIFNLQNDYRKSLALYYKKVFMPYQSSGTYNIFIKQGNQDVKVGCCENKGSFGELALMYNMPRAATIQSAGDGMLWAMDRQTFRRIVLRNAFQKRKMYEALLEKVPLLSSLNPYERMNLADALTSKTYKRGAVIIQQGDPADGMYFIETGEVSVTVVGNDGSERQVTTISEGGYFGELALVTHKARAATVSANAEDVRVAFLDVNAFERLLGPCMDVMKDRVDDYEDQLIRIFGSKANISDIR